MASDDVAEKFVLQISLDTGPNHLRNMVVEDFAQRLRAKAGNELDVHVFHSGQLAKGRDEPKALYWDTIQMAVPGITSLARFEPNVNLFSLPMFYGLSAEITREVASDDIVEALNEKLEKRLSVKVIGAYLELGHLNSFTTHTPIKNVDDYAGLKMRIPGGAVNIERYKLLGANPVAIPFSDLALALGQKAVDGICSSYETIRSGQLWNSGVLHVFEDHGVFVHYIPMVSKRFWNKIPQHLQEDIEESWRLASQENIVTAALRQKEARAEFIAHGGKVIVADPDALSRKRQEMMVELPRLVRKLRLEQSLVEKTRLKLDQVIDANARQGAGR